jgi:GNAT superfamily N-acetyltransferase
MIFRLATSKDIPGIQLVRNAVKENRLSNPALVPDSDVDLYIHHRGRGWVCEIGNQIVGFSIADLQDDNIWALFVEPGFEKRGIGSKLQQLMLDWYFEQGKDSVWLGTAPGTRAESFYRATGWKEIGTHGKGEVKFQLTKDAWLRKAGTA